VAGCTTKESLYEDNANRSFLIYIDESPEQDEKIMNHQRKLSAGKVDVGEELKTIELLQNTQRVLQPIAVRNPFAEKLHIPKEVFKPRRTNAHYLAFIEAVTFYHQYQREKQHDKETGEEFIETTLGDIREANQLLKDILIRKSDDLSGACRGYFERLKIWLQETKKETFTISEAMRGLRVKETTVRRYHRDLTFAGLLRFEKIKGDKTNYYQIVSYADYQELKERISTVLDKKLGELENATIRQSSATRKMADQKPRKSKS